MEISYFEKLAKAKGLKKVTNDYGDKTYTDEEVYDVVYDFIDNLLTNISVGENIAQDWFKEF